MKTSSPKRIPFPLGERVGAVALSLVEGRRRPDEGSWRSLWERFPTSIPGFRVLCATCYANLEFRVWPSFTQSNSDNWKNPGRRKNALNNSANAYYNGAKWICWQKLFHPGPVPKSSEFYSEQKMLNYTFGKLKDDQDWARVMFAENFAISNPLIWYAAARIAIGYIIGQMKTIRFTGIFIT